MPTTLTLLSALLLLGAAPGNAAEGQAQAVKDCAECPELVMVPAGKFKMGSEAKGALANEKPVHEVTFAKGFAIGKYEVTFAEWDACVADKGCTHKPGDQGWGRGKQPVTNIGYTDAQEYVSWLSKKSGKTYRLPTEAEWEYAARGGATTEYPWGDEIGKGNANCAKCNDKDVDKNAPVGSYKPNGFGLYDVVGNVAEWVGDCYEFLYTDAPKDGTARSKPNCSMYTVRGGSWHIEPRDTRLAARQWFYPYNRFAYLGFRVVRAE